MTLTLQTPVRSVPVSKLPFAGLAIAGLLLVGCVPGLRAPADVMPTRVLHDPGEAVCSVVLLPGMFDTPKDFYRHGFGDALAARGVSARVIAADAHFGYYRKRSILDRLHEDVIAPELDAGRKVWLTGISLGGGGTLLYGRFGADQLEGMVLLAPFLGDDDLLAEIRAAGGPLAWSPEDLALPTREAEEAEVEAERGNPDREKFARRSWHWLSQWKRHGGEQPQIYLGWGVEDDFADSAELASELLAEGHARSAPGGHDWDAWSELWQTMVDDGVFDGCGTTAAPIGDDAVATSPAGPTSSPRASP